MPPEPTCRPLGAHMSIAGGLHKAVERAHSVAATALQIFTKNQLQWHVPTLTGGEIDAFADALKKSDVAYVCAHASYLINLASPDDDTREKGCNLLVEELRRGERLGCACLVLHPGSGKTLSAEDAEARLVSGLQEVLCRTAELNIVLALENTAGQGNCLGRSLSDLGRYIDACNRHHRLGVCLDSCHAFAAGYDLTRNKVAQQIVREIRERIGLDRLSVLHLNDSKTPCNSRRDRHAHVGKGEIGEIGFFNLLRANSLSNIPGIIETPKDAKTLREDRTNLAILRRLDGQPHRA